jgi:hypothetical protein
VILHETNTLWAPAMFAFARSLAVGARHDAAVGRGEFFCSRIARSTLPGVASNHVANAGWEAVVELADLHELTESDFADGDGVHRKPRSIAG